MVNNGHRQPKQTQIQPLFPEQDRFTWLHSHTLFGQSEIAQSVTQVERQVLEPILGANKIQLFRNFYDIKIIPTGHSFLLQGAKPINGRSSGQPFLDIQINSSKSKATNYPKAYVSLPEPKLYHAIARLLEQQLLNTINAAQLDQSVTKLARKSQSLTFFPRILDSILSPTVFKSLRSLPRIKLTFKIEKNTILVKTLENGYLFSLNSQHVAYYLLIYLVCNYPYYQSFNYPLPDVLKKSLIVLSIEQKVTLPYYYLKPRLGDIFDRSLQDPDQIGIELLPSETADESRLVFSSSDVETQLYPDLKLRDPRVPELLGMLYCLAYPEQKQKGDWQKASTLFRFISLYELFQDKDFNHFQLTQIPVATLLNLPFDDAQKTELKHIAINGNVEVQFIDLSEGLNIDLRLLLKSPQSSMVLDQKSLSLVTLSIYHSQFYNCINAITQIWSNSEERLRFLDTNWINKLVERLRPIGNYWISYFELQPHLEKLLESSKADIKRQAQNLLNQDYNPPRPYFRYFLGIYQEHLIISPYPIFPTKWETDKINPQITAKNSLRLNIFTSRTSDYMGFCRKALVLAKNLLDLGSDKSEERLRFNTPKVVLKIETHTLAFLQRYSPPFPEVVSRLQTMLLDMSLYAPQAYQDYLLGYPTDDVLSKLKARFLQLTPNPNSLNLLDASNITLYSEDPTIQVLLKQWKELKYSNPQVLELLTQSLHLSDKRKQLYLYASQPDRIEALSLRLDTLLKSIQAITRYEVQLIAHQPSGILEQPEIQDKLEQLITLSTDMETECQQILKRLLTVPM